MSATCPHCGARLGMRDLRQFEGPPFPCPKCQGLLELSLTAVSSPEPIDDAPPGMPPQDKQYSLKVLDGTEPGTIFPIKKSRVIIGRQDCEILLMDPEISRQHASLTIRGDSALLEDLGSGNGTFVEGQRVTRIELKSGASFRVGTHQLVFLISERSG